MRQTHQLANQVFVTTLQELGDEVMAHLRGVVGSDALLAAYNSARERVRTGRSERKKKAVMKVGLSPVWM